MSGACGKASSAVQAWICARLDLSRRERIRARAGALTRRVLRTSDDVDCATLVLEVFVLDLRNRGLVGAAVHTVSELAEVLWAHVQVGEEPGA